MNSSVRQEGRIKFYHRKKHFGFIVSHDENREVFFHIVDCKDFFPEENLQIEFNLGLDPKGRTKALNILPKGVSVSAYEDKN